MNFRWVVIFLLSHQNKLYQRTETNNGGGDNDKIMIIIRLMDLLTFLRVHKICKPDNSSMKVLNRNNYYKYIKKRHWTIINIYFI
ncbi:hypothetical protein BGP_5533 [Beggiatoa sp. PS]|nr:hypothetical protein BGP_5533 [Beggiatoa sp. PS]